MHTEDSIVLPVCNAKTPVLGSQAILIAAEDDLRALQQRLELPDQRQLYMSRVLYDRRNQQMPALIGPVMGAPYAAMLLEIIHAWGAHNILFWGWCGSITPELTTGDIVLPVAAFIDEGTSLHYKQSSGTMVHADTLLTADVGELLNQYQMPFHRGVVWTIDALFRETRDKIIEFQKRGACVVEMEYSALLSVAVFRSLRLSGILSVSDELFTFRWKPGFKDNRFIKTRRAIAEILSKRITDRSLWKSID